MKQQITLNEKQLTSLIQKVIKESVDEGRFGNFFNSLGKGIKGTFEGGLNQGRQMYNQTMADRSQADSDAASERANQLAAQANYGYKNIPACQKISAKYDQKIAGLQNQVKQLQTQKKQELQQARKNYMSSTLKESRAAGNQANAYGNRAMNAGNKANAMLNKRRNSLGLGDVDQTMQYGRVAESYDAMLDRIIKESFNKMSI